MFSGEAAEPGTIMSAFAAPEVQKSDQARAAAEPVASATAAGPGSPAPTRQSLRGGDGPPSLSRPSSTAASGGRQSRNMAFGAEEEDLPEGEPSRREFDDAAGSEEVDLLGVVVPDSANSRHSGKQAAVAVDVAQQFDRELAPNWGLTMLVSVGENWLPSMLRQDAEGAVTDIPVLKLFEVGVKVQGWSQAGFRNGPQVSGLGDYFWPYRGSSLLFVRPGPSLSPPGGGDKEEEEEVTRRRK